MSFCTNTNCPSPENPDTHQFCIRCGQPLLLHNHYRPLHPLGHGGFGRTYLAIDEYLPSGSRCVIKQLSFQGYKDVDLRKAAELFRQEAVRLDELRHHQIPHLLEYFEQENQLYLVQELIEGWTLAKELKQQGLFTEGKIQQLLKNLLPVLQFIHSQQVIHRDIKPDNIMRRSLSGDLVLIDFGIAKHITNTAFLQPGTVIGSPEYMAPEQTQGRVVPASDLYSLGVTCIHLLTGISPFDLFDTDRSSWVWRNYLPQGISISTALGNVLDKLLENAIANRYHSATEVLRALDTEPELREEIQVRVNYQYLEDLLKARKWQLADQQTWVVMCQASSKPIGSYLFSSDIKNMDCKHIQVIDKLWTQFSGGNFGFSIQRQIYENCGGDYGKFCAAVGWTLHNSTSSTQELSFRRSAPAGHLPSHPWVGGTQFWQHMNVLVVKLASCF